VGIEIKYGTPDGERHDDPWLLLSDAVGCCQAFALDDTLRCRQLRRLLDVYAGPTNTSKR